MGKGIRFRGRDWSVQLAIALGYALAYCAIRPFSDAHWSLTSGLRFACLLLIPYRYWAALAIGEAVPLLYSIIQYAGIFGTATVAIWSLPPIMTAMPVAWFCRSKLGLFPAKRIVDVKVLLTCALAVSLLWTGVTYAGLYVEIEPQRALDHISPVMVAGLLAGNYVAILTMVTWPLLLKLGFKDGHWKRQLIAAAASPLSKDTIVVALPSLAAISIISTFAMAPINAMLQMSLFLPVAWLAVKYGWRGVAACAPVAVACVCLLTRSVPDFAVIQAQGFLAFAVTCLFIMGARIASQLHVAEREREAVKAAMRVAQQCVHQADMRLRSTSQSLELVSGSMSIIQGRVVERVKMFLPDSDRQILLRQASITQNSLYRIAESLHPSAWRERGLPAALRETIGRAVDEIGVTYACQIHGRGLSQLPMPIHQAIYRFAVEGVSFVSAKRRCQHIGLTLRGGRRANGHRWAVLRIAASGDPLTFDTPVAVNGHQSIAALLGAQGMNVEAIKDQVALYGGTLHVKQADGTFTLTILVHDLSHLSSIEHTHPLGAARLWVH